jgi:hypothetical protein
VVGVGQLGLGGLDDVVDEGTDPQAKLVELGGEGEVDGHRRNLPRSAVLS